MDILAFEAPSCFSFDKLFGVCTAKMPSKQLHFLIPCILDSDNKYLLTLLEPRVDSNRKYLGFVREPFHRIRIKTRIKQLVVVASTFMKNLRMTVGRVTPSNPRSVESRDADTNRTFEVWRMKRQSNINTSL